MDLQSQFSFTSPTLSSSGLSVPLILPALIARIKELHGESELGIFRISVGKDELDSLRRQLDVDRNYDLSSVSNPHVCAALLKEWLRGSEEPLIGKEFYDAAINSVKGANQSNPTVLSDLFSQFPPLNQRILLELSSLASFISTPAYAEKNKMTMENLAIVFAPSLLRCVSTDPYTLLENSKYETKFTASCMRKIGEIKW